MEVVHFLLLSCSFEKSILVQWFFTYTIRSPCIAFLSSFAAFVRGYLEGNYFREELSCCVIFVGESVRWAIMLGRNCPRGSYPGGSIFLGDNYSGGNHPEGNCLGGNFHRGQLSVGAIVRRAIIREAIFLGDNCPRTQLPKCPYS